MEREQEIIQKYLKEKLKTGAVKKNKNCPDNQAFIDYIQNNLNEEKRKSFENHIAYCSFCLSQISIAAEALGKHKQNDFDFVPENIINKTKISLNSIKTKNKKNEFQKKAIKRRFFLAATIIFFVLSFIISKYFLQFLIGSLILGIRWSFESESGKTLIMILNSWRKHSHDKDDKISNQLKDQLKK